MKTPSLILATVLLSLGLIAGIAPAIGDDDPQAPTTLKVSTYNVCAVHCDDLKKFSSRVSAITSQIKSTSPDVAAIQELGDGSTRSSFRSRMSGYSEIVGKYSRYIYVKTSTMNVVSKSVVKLPSGKYAAYAYLSEKSTGNRFLVADVHLEDQDYKGRDKTRLAEMKYLMGVLNGVSSSAPKVILGDYNSLSRSKPSPCSSSKYSNCQRYRVHNYISDLGFKDAGLIASSKSKWSKPSYNQKKSDKRTFTGISNPFHLDHIYLSPGATASAWSLKWKGGSYGNQYSDHNMVTANISLPAF